MLIKNFAKCASALFFFVLFFFSMTRTSIPGALDATSSIAQKMRAVMFLSNLGWVNPPADLSLMTKTYPESTTSRVLCAVMGGPNKMIPLLNATDTDDSIRLFANGTPGRDSREFNGRMKGRIKWLKKLTDGDNSSNYTYADTSGHVAALEKWSLGLEQKCDHTSYDLTTFEGIVAHKNAYYEYHSQYESMNTYSILQPWRIVVWPWILDLMISSPNLKIGQFIDAGIYPDMGGNMEPYRDLTNGAFKLEYGFHSCYWPIHSCLIETVKVDQLQIPGVFDALKIEVDGFTENEGRGPSLKMIPIWLGPIIFEISRSERMLTHEDNSLSFNLVSFPNKIDEVRSFFDASTRALKVGCFGGEDAYFHMRATVRRDDNSPLFPLYAVLTPIIWSEIFVTALSSDFQKTVRNHPGRYFTINTGNRNGVPVQSEVTGENPYTTEQIDFSSADLRLTASGDCVEFQSCCSIKYRMQPGTYHCAWFSTLIAASSLGFNCDFAHQVLLDELLLREEDRRLESMGLPQISNHASKLIPGLQLRKLPKGEQQITAEYLLRCYVTGEWDPLLLSIGPFHTIAVVRNEIHCPCESMSLELTRENLQMCSDFANDKGSSIAFTGVRIVGRAPGFKLPSEGTKRKRKQNKRKRD